ncbi:MAG TPA: PIN domain-containing protein [Gemmataceae bacterium]|nr:PIN domain-containing protein [Gemmataceae bacterium]
MLIYLDTNIVIYAVENPAVFGPRAEARLRAISTADRVALSELTRTECGSYPLRHSNFALLRLYDGFFVRPDVMILPISTNVFRRATLIQAMHDFGTVDALHLATAVENGCQAFLTNDSRLSNFTDLTVEILR